MEEIIKINDLEGQIRIDKYLAERFPDKSRSYLAKLVDDGDITVNEKKVKSNYKLKNSDCIKILIIEKDSNIKPENMYLDIIYEDDHILVVNKKSGVIVHPATNIYSETLVNGLMYHTDKLSDLNGLDRPGIVHRIDKDTSGILVVAKTNEAHEDLARQFKEHTITREYIGIVEGVIREDSGTIDKPLARDTRDRKKRAIIEGGKNAVTHFEVLERLKDTTLVKCNLETGRTHQIRVHMASIHHPMVGDLIYGLKKKRRFTHTGQLLHAKKLGFIHPISKEYVEFDTELPKYFAMVIDKLK